MLLEGEALAIWLRLSEEEQDDFIVAKEKLINAMHCVAGNVLTKVMPKLTGIYLYIT